MRVQLNSSKFKSNDFTRMMPVSSEPLKSAKNSNSRQAYPVAESCMRDDSGGLGPSSPGCSRPNPASEAIIANGRPTPGCVQGLSSQTPAFVRPKNVLAEQALTVRCIAFRFVFRFRFYFGFIFRFSFRFSFRFILSASVSER